MRRHVTIIALFTLYTFFTSAHIVTASAENVIPTKSVQPTKLVTKAGTPQRGTLYRATYQGHTCYLFGTVHVGKAAFYPLGPQVTKALNQADELVIEVDIRDEAALQQAFLQYGLYPQGESIAQHISADTLTKLNQALHRTAIPFDKISRMKPWMIANLFLINELEMHGYPTEQGIEMYFLSQSKQQGKNVVALETAGYQLSLFDSMTPTQQEIYLRESMANLADGSTLKKSLRVLNAWRTANSKELLSSFRELQREKSATSSFEQKVLIDGRNPNMANKIELILKQDKASFVAIGAFHLLGENGVPALLQQRGYQVQKLY